MILKTKQLPVRISQTELDYIAKASLVLYGNVNKSKFVRESALKAAEEINETQVMIEGFKEVNTSKKKKLGFGGY